MKKSLMIAFSFALIAPLAACGKKAEVPKPTESAASGSMENMPMATQMKHDRAALTHVMPQPEIGCVAFLTTARDARRAKGECIRPRRPGKIN